METCFPKDDLICIICQDLPAQAFETSGCGSIICETCKLKILKCPVCGVRGGSKFTLKESKFIQRKINQLPASSGIYKKKPPRSEYRALKDMGSK